MFHPGIPRTLFVAKKIIIFNPQGFAEVRIRLRMCLCDSEIMLVLFGIVILCLFIVFVCGGGLTTRPRSFMLMLAIDCTAVYYVANCFTYLVYFSVYLLSLIWHQVIVQTGICDSKNVYCLTAVSCFSIATDFHIFQVLRFSPWQSRHWLSSFFNTCCAICT